MNEKVGSDHERVTGISERRPPGGPDGDESKPGSAAVGHAAGPGITNTDGHLEQRREVDPRSEPIVGEPIQDELPGVAAAAWVERYEGPMPHPSLLAGYEQVLPGSAERILAMAERAQAVQNGAITRDSRAESTAFVFATFALSALPYGMGVFAVILGLNGQNLGAIIAAAGAALTAAPSIIRATRRDNPSE